MGMWQCGLCHLDTARPSVFPPRVTHSSRCLAPCAEGSDVDRDGPCLAYRRSRLRATLRRVRPESMDHWMVETGAPSTTWRCEGWVKLNPTRNREAAPHQSPWPPPETHKYSPIPLRTSSISRPGADSFFRLFSLRLALRAPSSASVPRHHRHPLFRHIHTVKMRGEVRPHTTVALWCADMAPPIRRLLQGAPPLAGRRPPR